MPCIITSLTLQRSLRYAFNAVDYALLPRIYRYMHPRFRLYALVPNIIGAEFLDW